MMLRASSSSSSYNADHFLTPNHRFHLLGSLNAVPVRRQNHILSSNSLSSFHRSPIQAIATGESKVTEAVIERSLADRLRLGSLVEDRLSYKENFIVRCYEVGINKTATVETIANLLQEVGCNHAQSVGFSTDGFATTLSMRKLHLIWVTARMHIEIYKYPAWSDVIEIETWCQGEGRIGTRRDWILKDYATGEVIGRATSKWLMMNEDTRRLQKVTDDVRDELNIYCPKETRLSFPEPNNKSLKKISKLEDPAQYTKLGLVPRRADLDMNQHVNNVAYIGWVLESIPQDIIDTHELQTITLDYRRECQQDDVVDSLTSIETDEDLKLDGNNGTTTTTSIEKGEKDGDYCQFLHLLRLQKDGMEINRCRTEWRRKKPVRSR
ncbi:oleoyl-acyl carrier protein thioesterase 2, chloroplastic-like [Impatiens glandulifera]|uniref:oleoyl-acyl carrier protein thioesterase 2, chloroplastic-like n=1 Tax=Impatiens glandulifera TaxID=253017 RepID=UPI001FB08D66|nr:oleoyl-acyl carrier protein thioesterase 2, chloroplastic-like [Impatiens glandulifera]